GERGEDEDRHDRDVVELLREHGVHEAGEREDGGAQQHGRQRDPRVRDAHGGEQHGDAQHDHAHHQAAQHRAGHVAAQDHPGRHGADQQLLDVAPELGAEEAGRDVAVAVLDDAHHDQAGHDEVHVADAVHGPDPAADQAAED